MQDQGGGLAGGTTRRVLLKAAAVAPLLPMLAGSTEAQAVAPSGLTTTFARRYLHEDTFAIATGTGGTAMPLGSAFMRAGVYTLRGVTYDCTKRGLYRFKHVNEPYFLNRVVYDSTAGTNVYDLMSGVCWNHVHGMQDEPVPPASPNYQTISNRGIYTRWRLRCGYIAGLMKWVCPQLSITARVANLHTQDTATNGIDDGHVVLETKDPATGNWLMWDLTSGKYFRNSQGQHLSTQGFIDQIADGGPFPTTVRLSANDKLACSESLVAISGNPPLDLGLYCDIIAENSEAWYRRIFQTVTGYE